MNLAYFYPIIFWNTANLIVDSGSELIAEEVDEEEIITEKVKSEFDAEKILEDEESEVVEEAEKKKNNTSKYGKIASAIGRMQQHGVTIAPPDINNSRKTFTPDVEKNIIRYGLKGITKIGDSVVDDIIRNRPYKSFQDFRNKVKVNTPQVVNLIKCGAFDEFGSREDMMEDFIYSIAKLKETLNMRNAQMLIRKGYIPDSLAHESAVHNFNKYIRKGYDKRGYLTLDETAMVFYEKHFDIDKAIPQEDGTYIISEPYWKGIYDKKMLKIKAYINEHLAELLNKVNQEELDELTQKYGAGSLAKWSMDAVNFYQGEHELEHASLEDYDVVDFWDLPTEPVIKNRFLSKDGNMITLYHLYHIAGTVIDKVPLKSQITLLTTRGVITVQAYGVMAAYDKQISGTGDDGKKHVLESSWFKRGTKIIVSGMRRGEATFVAKKYRNMPGHHFAKIVSVDENGYCEVQEERLEIETEVKEDEQDRITRLGLDCLEAACSLLLGAYENSSLSQDK